MAAEGATPVPVSAGTTPPPTPPSGCACRMFWVALCNPKHGKVPGPTPTPTPTPTTTTPTPTPTPTTPTPTPTPCWGFLCNPTPGKGPTTTTPTPCWGFLCNPTPGKGPGSGRLLCPILVILLILVGLIALIVWLVYRPSDPRFSVVGAAIYGINTTSAYSISTTMQFTVLTHNPNKRTGVFYDRLSMYVSYKNQAITSPLALPVLFQEPDSTVGMSPLLGGGPVPVSQEAWSGLAIDEAYGVVALRLVLLGRLKWKEGSFWSSHYGIYVQCDMLVGMKRGHFGQVSLLESPPVCKVDV